MTNGLPIGTKKVPALWPGYAFLCLAAVAACWISFQTGRARGRAEVPAVSGWTNAPVCETDERLTTMEVEAHEALARIAVMQVQIAALYNVAARCAAFSDLHVTDVPEY